MRSFFWTKFVYVTEILTGTFLEQDISLKVHFDIITTSKWRILKTEIEIYPDKADLIVKCIWPLA